MAEIVWTQEAVSWLREIFDFIAAENPRAATRTIEAITSRVEQLKDFPESGTRVDHPDSDELRVVVYSRYRIVYRYVNPTVEIIGVFHESLDLAKKLSESREIDRVNE